jgi:hypothetical protein
MFRRRTTPSRFDIKRLIGLTAATAAVAIGLGACVYTGTNGLTADITNTPGTPCGSEGCLPQLTGSGGGPNGSSYSYSVGATESYTYADWTYVVLSAVGPNSTCGITMSNNYGNVVLGGSAETGTGTSVSFGMQVPELGDTYNYQISCSNSVGESQVVDPSFSVTTAS